MCQDGWLICGVEMIGGRVDCGRVEVGGVTGGSVTERQTLLLGRGGNLGIEYSL